MCTTCAAVSTDFARPNHLADAQRCKVAVGLAQPGALLFDIADQQIRNGHARIGPLGFIADHDDVG
jgi:hypothetical protein